MTFSAGDLNQINILSIELDQHDKVYGCWELDPGKVFGMKC